MTATAAPAVLSFAAALLAVVVAALPSGQWAQEVGALSADISAVWADVRNLRGQALEAEFKNLREIQAEYKRLKERFEPMHKHMETYLAEF